MNKILFHIILCIIFICIVYYKYTINKENFTLNKEEENYMGDNPINYKIVKKNKKDIGDVTKDQIQKIYLLENKKVYYYSPREKNNNIIFDYNQFTHNSCTYDTSFKKKNNNIIIQGEYHNDLQNYNFTISFKKGISSSIKNNNSPDKVIIHISTGYNDKENTIEIQGNILHNKITFIYNTTIIGYKKQENFIIQKTFHKLYDSLNIIILFIFSSNLFDYIREINTIVL